MKFNLIFSSSAKAALKKIKDDKGLQKRHKSVEKALRFLSKNPKHPGLHTKLYFSLIGPEGEKIFEVYAEQNTPAAYRIFFYYGHTKGEIIVFAIVSHP